MKSRRITERHMIEQGAETEACPCGSGATYAACCGVLHAGAAAAASAEQLMRSRYSAFVRGNAEYLQRSWHATTRPAVLNLQEQPAPQWLGLKIIAWQQQDEDNATVEFVARCKVNGKAERLHEISRFVREKGHWFYVEGDIR